MKKFFTKTTWFLLILCILSFIGHLIVYPMLPEMIPIQWSSSGEVSSWGQKYMDLILALLPIVIMFLMMVTPKIDPRKANYNKHSHVYHLFLVGITLLLVACSWLSALAGLGYDVNIHTLLPLALGCLFIAFGNHMPQIRSNYFFGIKTPWTLASDVVWKKTHKMGGILFCIMGILLIISAFSRSTSFVKMILVPYVFISILLLYGYSYLVFRRTEPDEK